MADGEIASDGATASAIVRVYVRLMHVIPLEEGPAAAHKSPRNGAGRRACGRPARRILIGRRGERAAKPAFSEGGASAPPPLPPPSLSSSSSSSSSSSGQIGTEGKRNRFIKISRAAGSNECQGSWHRPSRWGSWHREALNLELLTLKMKISYSTTGDGWVSAGGWAGGRAGGKQNCAPNGTWPLYSFSFLDAFYSFFARVLL